MGKQGNRSSEPNIYWVERHSDGKAAYIDGRNGIAGGEEVRLGLLVEQTHRPPLPTLAQRLSHPEAPHVLRCQPR